MTNTEAASHVSGTFPRSMSIVNMGRGVKLWCKIFVIVIPSCNRMCVCSLQETDIWKVTEMSVIGYVCYGWGEVKTAIWGSRWVCKAPSDRK